MNKRIAELYKKGYVEIEYSSPDIGNPDVISTYVARYFDPEKFAELIIRDCIDCVDGYTKPRTFGTHYDAVEQIKANFGIE